MSRKQGERQIKTVRCPYIPQHIMPEQSLLNHLSKCSAPNKHLFTKCRYNPLHVYPNAQIDEHYKKCKDRMRYEKEHEQSSDDWDSDHEQNQISQPVINKVKKRQGNRTNERNDKKMFDTSCIKKKDIDDSDDDWSPIIIDAKQQPKQQKNANRSAFNDIQDKKIEKNSMSSTNRSNVAAQNRSFNEKSSLYSNKQKRFQQNISFEEEQKNEQFSSSDGISLNSQSFSSKNEEKDQKEASKSKEKSFETLKSYSRKSKKGDNSKNISNQILSKSVMEENFEVEDF